MWPAARAGFVGVQSEGPQRTLLLVECSAIIVLTFSQLGVPNFHFALEPENYAAGSTSCISITWGIPWNAVAFWIPVLCEGKVITFHAPHSYEEFWFPSPFPSCFPVQNMLKWNIYCTTKVNHQCDANVRQSSTFLFSSFFFIPEKQGFQAR